MDSAIIPDLAGSQLVVRYLAHYLAIAGSGPKSTRRIIAGAWPSHSQAAKHMRELVDDFSNPELARFYDILPGVGNLTRRSDGLLYSITPGPDGPASALDFFTIDSLGRPQPPTAKMVLEFRGSEWSVEALIDYDFETRTNGRAAHFGVAIEEPNQLYQHGIALVRSADLDPKSHALVACMYNEPAEPQCKELTRTPRNRNWFRIIRSSDDFTVEWSEDGVSFATVLSCHHPCPHLSQFVILNSSSFAGGASFILRSLKILRGEVIEAPRRPRPFSASGSTAAIVVKAAEIIEALREHRDVTLNHCEISGVVDLGMAPSPITPNIRMHGCRFTDRLIASRVVTLSGAVLLTECTFDVVGLSNAHFTRLFQAVGCEFASDTRFIETNFAAGADFSLSHFREKPFFRVARAGRALSFYHCNFSKGADLSSGRFHGDVSIADVAVESGTLTFYGSEISGILRLMATLQRDPQPLGDAIDFSTARIGRLVISSGDRQNRVEYTGPARWNLNSSVFLRKAVVGEMLLYNVSFRNLVDLTDSSIHSVNNDGAEFERIVGEWPVEAEYYSCFISYSSKDHVFANQFYNDLVMSGVECWFAPESLKTGDEFRQLIIRAIRKYDRLLLVLSGESVTSEWVEFEVKAAVDREVSEKRKVLVPIRLDDAVLKSPQPWAVEIRGERQIGDFSRWKDPDDYRAALDRLRQELKPPKRWD